MFYPTLSMPVNQRNSITTFFGYNHNDFTEIGEFYDMKNMSSDYYPYIGTRDRRKCMLSINNLPYITVEPTITTSFDAQVSKVTIYYKAEKLVVGGKETVIVNFTADDTLIDTWDVAATYTIGDYMTVTETKSDLSSISFVTPENTVSIEVEITANVIDVEHFDESVVSAAVKNYSCDILNHNIRGMILKEGIFFYMVGSKLYASNENVEPLDFSSALPEDDDYRTEVQIISYNKYMIIFPFGIVVDWMDWSWDTISRVKSYGTGHSVTYTMSDASGEVINASDEKPENPNNGDYWCDTDNKALYQWSDSLNMWVGVSATYILIEIDPTAENFVSPFNEGDVLFMNTPIEDINNGSVIQKIWQDGKGTVGVDWRLVDYILIKGYYYGSDTYTLTDENPLVLERRCPKLNYVCVSQNRIWGCYHGYDFDEETYLNEIHASALGDPFNWYKFEGTAMDSYTVSIGSDGDFTGIATFQGYPTIFKEDVVYRIYGSYPAQYQLYTYECRGVQKGSYKSLSICNEYLLYKSVNDVCIFDGDNPTSISKALGNDKYTDAAAGSCLGKYYISMVNEAGKRLLFTYDMEKGIWIKEDNLEIEAFSYNESGELYGRSSLKIYGFGHANDDLDLTEDGYEKQVEWFAETGELGLDFYAKKYIKRIIVRAKMGYASGMDIQVSTDEGEYKTIYNVRGTNNAGTWIIPVNRLRCDSFRIKLSGYGKCVLQNLAWEIEEGEIGR